MTQRRPGFPARVAPVAAPAAGARVQRAAPPAGVAHGLGLDSQAVRARMVQRLAAAGLGQPALLQALATVERHRFVDSALVNQAYEDTSLPIGLGQTISKPSVVARMLELLLGAPALAGGGARGRVLEIGTGCGYQAALLARLVGEVYSIERLRALHERARAHLRPLRLSNVHLILGDGMLGYAAGAPYAAIISAAGGAQLPPQWCEQLAPGGRLVAPVEGGGGRQSLLVVDKTATGALVQQVLEAVHFVPLKSGIA